MIEYFAHVSEANIFPFTLVWNVLQSIIMVTIVTSTVGQLNDFNFVTEKKKQLAEVVVYAISSILKH